MGVAMDFVAMVIRRSFQFLGKISIDDLLETIFSKFCIGKQLIFSKKRIVFADAEGAFAEGGEFYLAFK